MVLINRKVVSAFMIDSFTNIWKVRDGRKHFQSLFYVCWI